MKQSLLKAKIIVLFCVFLWASAFVGIRAGLQGYTPGGLALLRYVVASICMWIIMLCIPTHTPIRKRHQFYLIIFGMFGIGLYNIALNYGELSVPSGMASFIISVSPLITFLCAVAFKQESLNISILIGMLTSILGVGLIMLGGVKPLEFYQGTGYVVGAMLISGVYSVIQKPFLQHYHVIEVTAYLIWGATLFLLIYTPEAYHSFQTASWQATLAVIYLGIFPAAAGYLAWSYGLKVMPASTAANYLYFMPLIATLLGWIWLNEAPTFLSLVGGLVALLGVWIVKSNRFK